MPSQYKSTYQVASQICCHELTDRAAVAKHQDAVPCKGNGNFLGRLNKTDKQGLASHQAQQL
eukprot:1151849-Pelagomonas_calceolata.AAC.4